MNIEQAMEILECIALSDAITPEIDEAVTVVLDKLSGLLNTEPIKVVMDMPGSLAATGVPGYVSGLPQADPNYVAMARQFSQSYQDYLNGGNFTSNNS